MRMLNKIKKILMIELGTLIFALSVGMFILPGRILTGGVAGITSLLAPFVPFSEDFMNIGINTFLFIIGSIFLGREFFTNTLIYSISYPFALLFVTRVLPDTIDIDPLLASVYGGILGGLAIGIMFRNGGSSGGTDVIALLAEKFTDTVTVLTGLYLYGLNAVLIGLISVFLLTLTLNWSLNIYGGIQAKRFEIISDQYDKIAGDIHSSLNRGTTILDVQGGYTGNKKKMLLAVVSEDQSNQVKEIIDKYDPEAFVIISEAKDVNGEGFTFEPRM